MITGDEWPEVGEWPDIPSHLAAEAAVIGHILLDNASHDKTLVPDDFSLNSNSIIFLRMTEMLEAGMPVDIVTLSNNLAGRKCAEARELDHIGGVAYLAGLTEGLLRCAAVTEYVAILKEKTKLRRIMAACATATEKCVAQGESAEEIVGQLGTALKGIRKRGK